MMLPGRTVSGQWASPNSSSALSPDYSKSGRIGGADVPGGLPDQIGLYVDEGYKTLAPRNLVEFGETRWHPDDAYPGWFGNSPITQALFYLAFGVLGQELESARWVSLSAFALLLVAFAYGSYGNQPTYAVGLWIIMLGSQHIIWVFSRVALFEMTGIGLVFGTLLILRKFNARPLLVLGSFAAVGSIAARGVKLNAGLVLLPALFGMLASMAIGKWSQSRLVVFCLLSAVACLAPAVAVKAGVDLPFGLAQVTNRVDIFPVTQILERFVANSILKADPFIMILGSLSAIWLLLHRREGFIGNPYRCALVSVAFMGIGILALTGAVPLRYCIWVLPAYLLLLVEWWVAQRESPIGGISNPAWTRISTFLAAGLVVLFLGQLGVAGIWLFRDMVPYEAPQGKAIFGLLGGAAILAFPVWKYREVALSSAILRRCIYASVAVWFCFNLYKVTTYIANPTWQVRSISNEIERILPTDAVMAGDWAPLFGLGTQLRVLYMHPRHFNKPEDINLLGPSHFLYCGVDNGSGDDGMIAMKAIQETKGVSIGEPVFEGEYTGRKVILYRLRYGDMAAAPNEAMTSVKGLFKN
jgi:hypothetical protein